MPFPVHQNKVENSERIYLDIPFKVTVGKFNKVRGKYAPCNKREKTVK